MKPNRSYVWAAVQDGEVIATVEGNPYVGISNSRFMRAVGTRRYSVQLVEGPVRG